MKPPRPSLVRRLTVAFTLAHAVALVLFLLALWPFARNDSSDQIGPDVAISLLSADLLPTSGFLQLRPSKQLQGLARRSPGFWFFIRNDRRLLEHGTIPADARALLSLPATVKWAELGGVGPDGRVGDASIQEIETAAGRVTIAAGGVAPEAVTFPVWIGYLFRDGYLLIPLLSALPQLLGGLIAIPLVLRSLRPTVRASEEIKVSDLSQRLPESRVVREVLPLVRAFNAALDRLAAGFESRKRFIADMAHELRTPLAVMAMHVDALPPCEPRDQLRRTVFRLGQMIGQMLDAERLALAARKHEPVELVALARNSVAEIAPLAVSAGYDLDFSTDSSAVWREGDPHALSRALANLLGNAVAHGGNRGTIRIKVHADGRLDVSDDGPGVAPDARERIFEPFHRERWDRDGCGLGLHLVQEVMRAHGGEATLVETAPGSTFRLRLGTPAFAA